MTKWSFGKEERASLRCKDCFSTPAKKPERWEFLTEKELSKCPMHIRNKAKQLGLEQQVYKGTSCRVCGPKKAEKNKEKRDGFKERFEDGEEICPTCGEDSPGIHDLPKPKHGKYPLCFRCKERMKGTFKKHKGKKRKAEETYIDETTQRMCYGSCNRAVPNADFVRFYLRRGKLWMDDDITRFKYCTKCALANSKTKLKIYQKTKYKQSQEKMSRAMEDMELHQTNGCYTQSCPCNIKDWFAHCEGRTTGGSGTPEQLPLRKKTLAYDWDHRNPNEKKGNVSDMRNQEERTQEIEGNPARPQTTGCALPCIPCHKEKTWVNFENRGRGGISDKRMKLRSIENLIITMKREKWESQGRRCGRPECPMHTSLENAYERMKVKTRNQAKYSPIRSAENYFLMFYMEFEHLEAVLKAFSLVSRGIRGRSENEVRAELNKTLVYCVFCARLKTMESGDSANWALVEMVDKAYMKEEEEGSDDKDEDDVYRRMIEMIC